MEPFKPEPNGYENLTPNEYARKFLTESLNHSVSGSEILDHIRDYSGKEDEPDLVNYKRCQAPFHGFWRGLAYRAGRTVNRAQGKSKIKLPFVLLFEFAYFVDIVTSSDGRSDLLTKSAVLRYGVTLKEPGDVVALAIVRSRDKDELEDSHAEVAPQFSLRWRTLSL